MVSNTRRETLAQTGGDDRWLFFASLLFPAFICGVSIFNNWLTQRAYEKQLSGANFTEWITSHFMASRFGYTNQIPV